MEVILFSITCLGLLWAHWVLTQPQRDAKLLASITPEEAEKMEALISGQSFKEIVDLLQWAFLEEEGQLVDVQKARFNDHEVWVVFYFIDEAVVINGLLYQKDNIWHLAPSLFMRPRLGILLSIIICSKWRT